MAYNYCLATRATITSGSREFFELIAQIAFCNPFTDERPALDAKIVGHPVDLLAEAHLDEMTGIISAHVRKLEEKGTADLRLYSTEDRTLLRIVFLFEIYHQFYRDFDQLILEQVRLGIQVAPVKFAGEVLARMRRRGIPADEALRFFSFFYQLRRGFYFIARGLVGRSRCMKEFRRHLFQNVFTEDIRVYEQRLWNRMEDFSTLLLGETGTGKGTAAAAIGRSGFIPFDERQNKFAESFMRGFVSLNLSQFPETLIESELFGHRKGAFTGAAEAHEGVLARCSPHGAIFLDEIGDVSVPVQIKLLQVLQERTFSPVGSHETVRFRGRVIAATNQPLEQLRGQKLFREDFFYRLSSDMIVVPPLRERLQQDPHELRELLEHVLLGIIGQKDTELILRIERAILDSVGKNYSWPGNVRELAQAARRILITGRYEGSETSKTASRLDKLTAAIDKQSLNADDLLASYCALIYDRCRNYEEVARRTNLDRRTVKKYISARRFARDVVERNDELPMTNHQ